MTSYGIYTQSSSAKTLSKAPVVLFLLGLLLLPLYLAPSALPQLSDIPLVILMIYVSFTLHKHDLIQLAPVLLSFSLFVLWGTSINLWYYLCSYDIFYVLASLHLIYVFMLFLSVTILSNRYLKCGWFKIALLCTTLLSISLVFSVGGHDGYGYESRHTLSFNNPNQLAYFACSILSIAILLIFSILSHTRTLLSKILIMFTFLLIATTCHYLIVLSASRAGLVTILILDGIIIWRALNNTLRLSILCMLLVVVMCLLTLDKALVDHDLVRLPESMLTSRLLSVDYATHLKTRATMGFQEAGILIVFGIGTAQGRGEIEAHNTISDILLSYGFIGLLLFGYFFVIVFRKYTISWVYICVFIALIPFHMSHNMIRFRSIWILYALMYSMSLSRSYILSKDVSVHE